MRVGLERAQLGRPPGGIERDRVQTGQADGDVGQGVSDIGAGKAVDGLGQPAQGRVHIPWLVCRGQDEHALVLAGYAVELGQQLHDGTAHGRIANGAALLT